MTGCQIAPRSIQTVGRSACGRFPVCWYSFHTGSISPAAARFSVGFASTSRTPALPARTPPATPAPQTPDLQPGLRARHRQQPLQYPRHSLLRRRIARAPRRAPASLSKVSQRQAGRVLVEQAQLLSHASASQGHDLLHSLSPSPLPLEPFCRSAGGEFSLIKDRLSESPVPGRLSRSSGGSLREPRTSQPSAIPGISNPCRQLSRGRCPLLNETGRVSVSQALK